MKYQIVIARYNEDINYLLKYCDISIVYNKGDNNIDLKFNYINLPNIGRESHTYLYHIIQNYDNLADKTLFIQGNIKDHKLYPLEDYLYNNDDFIANKNKYSINFLKKNIVHEGKYLKELLKGNLKKSKYTPYEWINLIGIDIFHSNIKNFEMVWGANFSVSKDLILKKPKIFYENIINYVEYDNNPEEGHYFERSWNLIFNHPIFIKKKIILYDFHNINKNIIDKYQDILNDSLIEEIHLWNNTFNEILNVRYINSIKYIKIYPNKINNSFLFQINNNLDMLLNFNNKKYEILFNFDNKNIKIKDFDTYEIIEDINLNLFFNTYIISWNNNILRLIYINNLKENILLTNIDSISTKSIKNIIFNKLLLNDTYNINDISIKSNNNTFINYSTKNNSNVYNMVSTNYIDKNFYKNNYENYYFKDLTEFILDKI